MCTMVLRSSLLLILCAAAATGYGAAAAADDLSEASPEFKAIAYPTVALQSDLVAHVKILAEDPIHTLESPQGHKDRQAYFVEVIDSAHGPPKGAIAALSVSTRRHEKDQTFEVNKSYVVIARLRDDGTYSPLGGYYCNWPVVPEGDDKLRLSPRQAWARIARLRPWCEQLDLRVRVEPVAEDLTDRKGDSPLRVRITIDNRGREMTKIANSIDWFEPESSFEGDEPWHVGRRVTLFVDRERDGLEQAVELVKEEPNDIELRPGQRMTATVDLRGELGDSVDRTRMVVRVQVGGYLSRPVQIDVKQPEDMLELELTDLPDVGPFTVGKTPKNTEGKRPARPPVAHQVLDHVLDIFVETSRRKRPYGSSLDRPIYKEFNWSGAMLLHPFGLPEEYHPQLQPRQGHERATPDELERFGLSTNPHRRRLFVMEAWEARLHHVQMPEDVLGRSADGYRGHVAPLPEETLREYKPSPFGPIALQTSAGELNLYAAQICVDEIKIDGDAAVVKVRYALSDSGVRYDLRKRETGWEIINASEYVSWRLAHIHE